MKKWIFGASLALACVAGQAQVAPILLEACNQMEPASKRMECLRAANSSNSGSGNFSGSAPQSSYAASPGNAKSFRASAGSGSATCHVGPRGGTYTITASGRKNYGGC